MVTFAGAIAISSSGHAFASRNAPFRWIQKKKKISLGHNMERSLLVSSGCKIVRSVLRDGCDFRTDHMHVGSFRPSGPTSFSPEQEGPVLSR
mmetsp:Transcript_20941/g.49398  ORF Transcript_20941/g.49398 Transcript_20941/m.49398 type:complete len:92 (+) Transcript_20941:4128-4403(+)